MSAMSTVAEVPTLRAFHVEVRAVRRVCPTFVRLTFAGPDLAEMGTGGPAGTRDLRVKLLLPTGGSPVPDLQALGLGRGWYRRWLAMDERTRGVMRTYTVRELRPRAGELDVDVVLHTAADGRTGPAAAWAAAARPGDRLTVVGPNGRHPETVGIEWDPGASRRVLLAGDETAVPAVAAILRDLPAHLTGHALLEVPCAADVQQLQGPPGVAVRWLPRERGPHGELLQQEVRELVRSGAADGTPVEDVDVDSTLLWDTPAHPSGPARPGGRAAEDLYAWVAGEAAMVRDLRRYLVSTAGLDRRQVAFMGYWRQGRAECS
ncbi:siderophore-interacting protein [Georgenia sp. 10Sc9-8]|uniref:Siderophore-interacting protein n=1 Tax=Georgenia halotolerans TaxID=3028317 RepID=A0ABT5U1Y7_9MICO|nr:siderophore-interacting protein [Georgenia halotolerans]